ncbi:actin-binding protein WASF2-like isoform X1 [Dysidea avara]|uniref:actin-binding protein WASF2-like isoform X1 n=1 Tax=Dysidea avara TaxID=196820 RepID=UPI00331E628C
MGEFHHHSPPPMGWTDPNKGPPAPLTSPTPKANKVASPKQPAMSAFNPNDILKQTQLKKTKVSTGRSPSDSLPPPPPPPPQPTEPDWAPKEYLERLLLHLTIPRIRKMS